MKPTHEPFSLLILSLAAACTEPNNAGDPCGPLGCGDDRSSSGTGVSQDDGGESRGGSSPGDEGPGDGTDDGATAGSVSAGSAEGGSPPGSQTEGDATEGDATEGDADATEGETEVPPGCGDAAVDEGEACDDGELNGSYGQCNADCTGLAAHCGDGELQAQEQCDDANDVWDDGCDPDCVRSAAVDVESGAGHNCVILRSRDVKCWGYGGSGTLGYGSADNIGDDETPALVGTLPLGGPVQRLALGGRHSCALLMDGSVKCWGYNTVGQLGYGHTDDIGDHAGELAQQGFVSVDADRAVVQLTAAYAHTCALLEDGAVKCWGLNQAGQLGLGRDTPSPGAMPSDLRDVASGVAEVQAGGGHTCTREGSGVVRCWGGNAPYSGSLVAEVLALGNSHTCVARGTSVWCWGNGLSGVLGRGSTDPSTTPVAVTTLSGVTSPIDQLVAGYYHTCTRHHNGELRCWGQNNDGQLGNGRSGAGTDIGDMPGEPANPILIHAEPSVTVVDVSVGARHSCALLSMGGVRCWGSNSFGQLGTGTGTELNPGPPADLPDIELFAVRSGGITK